MKQFLTFILSLVAIMHVAAQDITVTGSVKDEKNSPLIGATITVKNSKTATTSDASGSFSIKASQGAVLEISYSGYLKKEVMVSGSGNIEITFNPETMISVN